MEKEKLEAVVLTKYPKESKVFKVFKTFLDSCYDANFKVQTLLYALNIYFTNDSKTFKELASLLKSKESELEAKNG